MARWQLMEPHYLKVPGTLWELQITDRSTGRPIRKQFPVPLHLDPNIEQDWNHREMIGTNVIDGKIVVCYAGKGEPKDIIFEGPPTPGMLPLDSEAEEISAKYVKVPITQGLDDASQAASWTQQLLVKLSDMTDQISAQPQVTGMSEFMKSMSDMMAAQTQVLAALVAKAQLVEADPAEQVVNYELPLEDAEAPTDADIAASAAIASKRQPSQPPIRRR